MAVGTADSDDSENFDFDFPTWPARPVGFVFFPYPDKRARASLAIDFADYVRGLPRPKSRLRLSGGSACAGSSSGATECDPTWCAYVSEPPVAA